MIVSLYIDGKSEFITIESKPENNDILDLDFNSKYLVQVQYQNGDFILTGNGIDEIYKGFTEEFLRLDEMQDSQIADLEAMLEEAIKLPKGVEPHSYSDYKEKNNVWTG